MKSFLRNIFKNVISLILTQETGNTVGASVFKFKNAHKWLFRLVYGTANDEEILNNVLQKIDGKIEILMIHSSLNNMIPMYTGNLSKLLSMIISYCHKNDITLAMPTFFLGSNFQAKEYYESGKNTFDVSKTMSEMGMLSEIFRRTPNAVRSIHPTHSVCALGPLAVQLTEKHHISDTTCGAGTPFWEMIKYKTIILGIGAKAHHSLTQIHSVEDIMKENYPIPLFTGYVPVKCIDEFGNSLIYNLRIKNPDYLIDQKSFLKIIKLVKITEWKYKGIPFYLTRADEVTETVIQAAKKGHTIYKLN